MCIQINTPDIILWNGVNCVNVYVNNFYITCNYLFKNLLRAFKFRPFLKTKSSLLAHGLGSVVMLLQAASTLFDIF